MHQDYLLNESEKNQKKIPVTHVHTLVIGSGASGLCAAAQLYNNDVKDLLIINFPLVVLNPIRRATWRKHILIAVLCMAISRW
jgi:hypothetical protein